MLGKSALVENMEGFTNTAWTLQLQATELAWVACKHMEAEKKNSEGGALPAKSIIHMHR